MPVFSCNLVKKISLPSVRAAPKRKSESSIVRGRSYGRSVQGKKASKDDRGAPPPNLSHSHTQPGRPAVSPHVTGQQYYYSKALNPSTRAAVVRSSNQRRRTALYCTCTSTRLALPNDKNIVSSTVARTATVAIRHSIEVWYVQRYYNRYRIFCCGGGKSISRPGCERDT